MVIIFLPQPTFPENFIEIRCSVDKRRQNHLGCGNDPVLSGTGADQLYHTEVSINCRLDAGQTLQGRSVPATIRSQDSQHCTAQVDVEMLNIWKLIAAGSHEMDYLWWVKL